MKMKLKTLKIIASPNVQGLLIFKRNEASLSQGQLLRIMAKTKCGPKIQLAMSVCGHTRDHTHPMHHLGNLVVALWLVCIAQDWPLLQKGQLCKQMPQPSINLDQRKLQLDLERKIARVQAKEQTYANAELKTASIKQPSGIPAQVLHLPLDQQPFSPMKPRPPMAPQETKPLENKYYEDVRLARKESPSWLIYWREIPTRTNRYPERAAEA